jgi:hypothetical protein
VRQRDLAAAALACWLAVAVQALAIGDNAGVGVTRDGVSQGGCEIFELPSGSWSAPSGFGGHCTLVPLGGPGGGVQPLLHFASCMALDGNAQTYLGAGGCADPNEPLVQGRVKSAATLGHLSCVLSGAAGGSAVVTATLRAGACGGLTDSSLNCTIASGQTTCEAGAATAVVSAGQCFAIRITSSAAFGSLRALSCSARITS